MNLLALSENGTNAVIALLLISTVSLAAVIVRAVIRWVDGQEAPEFETIDAHREFLDSLADLPDPVTR